MILKDTNTIQNNFLPAFNNNNVNIILSSSNSFSPYLGVCINSILANSSSKYNYDIIVFEREITGINKKRIINMAYAYNNISIRFFNVRSEMKKINFYINSNRLSQETYYGLLIPYLLPFYKKSIIMDCDMIVRKDLSKLFLEDLGNNIIGGVNDIVLQGWLNDKNNDTYDYYTKYLKIKNPFKCFNGGLILLDFDKYRKSISKDLILNYLNNYKLRVVDQDIFNILLEGKIKPLDLSWNHMIYVKGPISDSIKNAPSNIQKQYFKSREDPSIIHYAGDQKPWNNPEIEFADLFWEAARKTIFYEIILNNLIKYTISNTKIYSEKPTTNIKYKIKKFIKIFFPQGTKRHKLLKCYYFKLRGWSI